MHLISWEEKRRWGGECNSIGDAFFGLRAALIIVSAALFIVEFFGQKRGQSHMFDLALILILISAIKQEDRIFCINEEFLVWQIHGSILKRISRDFEG